MGELPEQRRAATDPRLAARARDPDELATLTVRDVHRSRGKGTTAAQVRAALRLLEEHGYVRLERQPAPGRGARRQSACHVNPASRSSNVTPTKPDMNSRSRKSREFGFVGYPSGLERQRPSGADTPTRLPRRGWRARDGAWRCSECAAAASPRRGRRGAAP